MPNIPAIALTKKGECYCVEAEAATATLATTFQSGQVGHSDEPEITEAEIARMRLAAAELVRIRDDAGAMLDRLLAALDALDGDPDLEENGDREPSLGTVNPQPGRIVAGPWRGIADQRVLADEGMDQRDWLASGDDGDLEAEHDGREDSGDDDEPGDNGIADRDALDDPGVGLVFGGVAPTDDFRGDSAAEARRMLAGLREART